MKLAKPNSRIGLIFLVTAVATGTLFAKVSAAPPHPDLLEQAAAGERTLPYFISHLNEMHAADICTGDNGYEQTYKASKGSIQNAARSSGPFHTLAVLVEFADNISHTAATYFDSLMFDTAGITVRDYYLDISYGQFDLVSLDMPSSMGWVMAPQTYAYYVNDENGTGIGSYPNNTQRLVEDLVELIDPSVDFSKYDNDSNGFVDVLVVIHAGQGAEKTGSNSDIHSHKWAIPSKLTDDGVYVSSFTIQPEYLDTPGDMTIGVYAHELGHVFGLPDLYDTDYSSAGIGVWGIMSFGAWLGPNGNGGLPCHPCAWSRIQMGFATAINVSSNAESQAIREVKTSGDIFLLPMPGDNGEEYFLVENRQKTGYDTHLPASGLQIWHIDDAKSGNDIEWWPGLNAANHYEVALEQADGLYELEHFADYGDAGDVFPGSTSAISFDASSAPTSDSYTDGQSLAAVENISSPADVMYADFEVPPSTATGNPAGNLPTSIELSQNYPNPFNPMTTIQFHTTVGGAAKLEVYNLAGQKVKTVLDRNVTVGTTTVLWDAVNNSGTEVASGIYFYRLTVNDEEKARKMVLVR